MCCYAQPNILGLSRNRGGGFVLELIKLRKQKRAEGKLEDRATAPKVSADRTVVLGQGEPCKFEMKARGLRLRTPAVTSHLF